MYLWIQKVFVSLGSVCFGGKEEVVWREHQPDELPTTDGRPPLAPSASLAESRWTTNFFPRGGEDSNPLSRQKICLPAKNTTVSLYHQSQSSTMGSVAALIANNRFILVLAEWVWESDPSSLVSPSICLDSLPLLSSPCLSRLVAKGIGVGIIFASCINKAPVIRNILQSKSVAGLSVAASYGEVILYSNAAFYNILRGNPFTAYGETFLVLLQTMVVISLIWAYEPKIGKANIVAALFAYCIYLFVVFQGKSSRFAISFEQHFFQQGILTSYISLCHQQQKLELTVRSYSLDTIHVLHSHGVQSNCFSQYTWSAD